MPQINSNVSLGKSYVFLNSAANYYLFFCFWKEKIRIWKSTRVSGCYGPGGLELPSLMKKIDHLLHAPLLKLFFILSFPRYSCSYQYQMKFLQYKLSFFKIIWSRMTLLLRKHIFLMNNTFIFISLKKDNVQYFPNSDHIGGGLLFL